MKKDSEKSSPRTIWDFVMTIPMWLVGLALFGFVALLLISSHVTKQPIYIAGNHWGAGPQQPGQGFGNSGLQIAHYVVTIAYGNVADRSQADFQMPLHSEPHTTPLPLTKDGATVKLGNEVLAAWIIPRRTGSEGQLKHIHLQAEPREPNEVEVYGTGVSEDIEECDLYVVYR
jgi:hypothetical protein